MMLFNDLLGKLYRNKLQQFFPLTLTDTGGSLWLRKTK
jgi:hypothetical protein